MAERWTWKAPCVSGATRWGEGHFLTAWLSKGQMMMRPNHMFFQRVSTSSSLRKVIFTVHWCDCPIRLWRWNYDYTGRNSRKAWIQAEWRHGETTATQRKCNTFIPHVMYIYTDQMFPIIPSKTCSLFNVINLGFCALINQGKSSGDEK